MQMKLPLVQIQLFASLAVASIGTSHQSFRDFVAKSFPIFERESPSTFSYLDGFYAELDKTFVKSIEDKEKARVYESVDAPTMWKLLCKENESLEEHYHILQTLFEKVSVDRKSNNLLLKMGFEFFSYFGCYLRSLIFGTNVFINSGQVKTLAVLNETRRTEMMDKKLNITPKMYYMEHLREIQFVYSKLFNNKAVIGECILRNEVGLFPDMLSKFFYYCLDSSLLNKPYYTHMDGEPPKFIMDHLHPEKDYSEIEDKKVLSRTTQAYQVNKYWHILTSYVSSEIIWRSYFIDDISFSQNSLKLYLNINRVNQIWKTNGTMLMEELRNLCCTFDFLYNYNQLLNAKENLLGQRKVLLSLIKEFRLL